MTTICAWCQPPTTDPNVSHGICEPCRRQMMAAYFGNSNTARTGQAEKIIPSSVDNPNIHPEYIQSE